MTTFIIVIGILLMLVGAAGICIMSEGDQGALLWTIVLILGCAFVFCSIADKDKDDDEVPSALDVYRGQTTLKITYVDGVPVDSAVVFKNEVK